jgi:ethanolamine utilization protein EutP (predicted NTPase)
MGQWGKMAVTFSEHVFDTINNEFIINECLYKSFVVTREIMAMTAVVLMGESKIAVTFNEHVFDTINKEYITNECLYTIFIVTNEIMPITAVVLNVNSRTVFTPSNTGIGCSNLVPGMNFSLCLC